MSEHSTPILVAHRGYAAAFPENTLLAIDAARKCGAMYIEVDVLLSSDHVPVLFHDRDMRRLTQQKGAIHEYDFAQLQSFYVTNPDVFGNQFSDNKITSLQELVSYIKQHPEVHFFIELKRQMINYFDHELVIEKIIQVLTGLEKQLSIISYDQSIIKRINDTCAFKTGIVVDHYKDYIEDETWHPDWLFCSIEGLPGENLKLDVKPEVVVFEVANPELAEDLLLRDIRYLETFRIKELAEYFYESNKSREFNDSI